MYPDRNTLSNVPRSPDITRENTLPVFFFVNEHKNTNTNTKPQAKKQRFLKLSGPEEKRQLVEEKYADNTRKVLCK